VRVRRSSRPLSAVGASGPDSGHPRIPRQELMPPGCCTRLVERAGKFLPRHWNRPQPGHCRGPHAAPSGSAVTMSSPCSSPCSRPTVTHHRHPSRLPGRLPRHQHARRWRQHTHPYLRSPRHHHPLEPLTRHRAHGRKHPRRGDMVVLRLGPVHDGRRPCCCLKYGGRCNQKSRLGCGRRTGRVPGMSLDVDAIS
jgi:hypothetical protein